MMQTDSQGHDLDLAGVAPSVRYYLLASFPHGAGNGPGICAQPRNPLEPNAALRALLVDLDAWVTAGQTPPADCMPRLADGTLVPPLPQEGYGFPGIPGVIYNSIHHTGDLFDSGPDFDKGIFSVLPPKLLGTPYPVFVPKADADAAGGPRNRASIKPEGRSRPQGCGEASDRRTRRRDPGTRLVPRA